MLSAPISDQHVIVIYEKLNTRPVSQVLDLLL